MALGTNEIYKIEKITKSDVKINKKLCAVTKPLKLKYKKIIILHNEHL